MRFLSLLLLSFAFAGSAHAKEFEIFDGQFYNGLYYPLVDMIEWGEQRGELPHMEFHIHSKDKHVDVAAVPGDKNGKPVLWIMFDLKYRGEHICRHVLAPVHFKQGMKLYTYRDDRDPDYDNVFFSSDPIKGMTEYTMPAYERCADDNASNMPEDAAMAMQVPAAATITVPGVSAPPRTAGSSAPAPATAVPAKDPKQIGVDYDNSAVPFSF